MASRTRKLIGSIALVAFVIGYFILAMSATTVWLGDKPSLLSGLAYAFIGLIWIVPAGAIISWTLKPRA
jgi:fucose permease